MTGKINGVTRRDIDVAAVPAGPRRRRKTAAASAAAVLLSAWAAAAGMLSMTVRDGQSGAPLADAAVAVEQTGRSARTDSTGRCRIDSVAPGSYNLAVSREGYEPVTRTDVYVAGAGEARVSVELVPEVYSLDKMVVKGTAFRRAPDMTSSTKIMDIDEILRAPGALTDVQRAVQNLPGVTASADNVNEVIVRGGTPGENLFILDNIEIPNPNHFAEQGSGGGVVSLINPLLVKGITFNAGAPAARYGGKASSVMDVKLRDGNDKLVLGGVDVGVGGAGIHLEGPLWPAATFMCSATRSYLDIVARFDESVAIPKYWGAQAKLTQNTARGRIGVNGIYGDNGIIIENARRDVHTRGDVIEAGGYVFAAGGTWEAWLTEVVSAGLTLSATGNSFDRAEYTDTAGEARTWYFRNGSREREQTLSGRLSLDFPGGAGVSAGAYGRRAAFDIDIDAAADTLKVYAWDGDSFRWLFDSVVAAGGVPVVFDERTDRRDAGWLGGGWCSATLRLWERLRVTPGVRADYFTYNKSLTVSPRLSAVMGLAPGLEATAAFGVQYQQPDCADLAASAYNRSLGPKRAVTGIAGLEYLFDRWQARCVAEAFVKRYDGLPVDTALLSPDPYDKTAARSSIGEGVSAGVELFAEKKLTDNVFWSAAYSFARSFYGDPRPGREGEWYPGDYDFRHLATLTGGWKADLLAYGWYRALHERLWFKLLCWIMPVADRVELSARWRYAGGRPYTEPQYDETHQRWVYDRERLNASRYEPYHRLDLRYERRYGFGLLQLIFYLDFQNIYNRRNLWTYIYTDGSPEAYPYYQIPFFPAGGLIIGF